MAFPGVVLSKGQMLIEQGISGLNLVFPSNPTVIFGQVFRVSALTNAFKAGDSVAYDSSQGYQISDGTDTYYLVNEINVVLIESIS